MTTTSECLICGGDIFSSTPYFYRFNGREIEIVACARCGLGTLSPMLSPEEIGSLYSVEYFDRDYHCGVLEGTYVQEVKNLRREMRQLLPLIQQYQPSGKYLEIGCAGGAMLAEAQAWGFRAIGVELSHVMAEWGKTNLKLDIRSGTLEEQQFSDQSFEVVFLGDVIEHLPKPTETLVEIRRILKPKGILALAYPMELSHFAPRIRTLFNLKRQSPHKPYHLFYYNIRAMRKLLAASGFHILLEKEDKLIRRDSARAFVTDLFNYTITALAGKFGDRGFTIARLKDERDV